MTRAPLDSGAGRCYNCTVPYIYMDMTKDVIPLNGAQNWQTALTRYMEDPIRSAVLAMAAPVAAQVREIRIRADHPVVVVGRYEGFLQPDGSVRAGREGAVIVPFGQCQALLAAMVGHAPYACMRQLGQGYVTMPGGYRVGLSGEVSGLDEQKGPLKSVTSMNIRIVRAIPGVADPVMPRLRRADGSIASTLVVSLPGMGKTTLIRDIARQLSDGAPGRPGCRVGIVDERGELGGCCHGVPTLDVGLRTDVLEGCDKARGILWMVRSMAPAVLVTDEIGGMEDVQALLEARNAGVAVIASAHGGSLQQVMRRPALRALARENLFDLYILLDGRVPGRIAGIWAEEGEYGGVC